MNPSIPGAAPALLTTRETACPLDCPDACSLEVTLEEGRVARVDGTHRNSLTAGFICAKVRNIADHLYCPERLLHPAVRTGAKGEGRFAPVTWDEALDRIVARIDETRRRHGGEAILPYCYGGSNGLLTHDAIDTRFFRRIGASRLLRTLCAAATGRAAQGLYGRMAGVALEDYVDAGLIVLWGVNPSASGIHLVPIIREARKRGARLVVVDPRRIPLARGADLHLAVRPGADLPLALAVVRWLFANGAADERFLAAHATGVDEMRRRAEPWTPARAAEATGVAAGEIERFARLYAETRPAVVRCGWGPERNRNGGSAIAAILALPAVAGKFGVRGGGYTMSNSKVWDLGTAVADPEPPTRAINMNLLGEELLRRSDPPIEVLFVYDANPLASTPNQERVRAGLSREDLFTVVFDQVMTDTARFADVLLPATTFLEHQDLARGYGAMVLQEVRPVAARVGEARPNHEVFADLCRRMALSRPGDAETAAALAEAMISASPRAAAIRASLSEAGIAFPPAGPRPIPFVDFPPPTPDGKVHLAPADLDAETPEGLYHFRPDPATAEFPLALISPATERTISSTLGQLHRKLVPVEIHPDDAAPRGIRNGDVVRVFNRVGDVRCPARINEDLRPGVALLPKGLWSHNTMSGTTATALAPDSLTDLGGGACFNDARVQIEQAE